LKPDLNPFLALIAVETYPCTYQWANGRKIMMKLLTVAMLAFLIQPSFADSETIKGAKKDLEKFKQEMSVELQAVEKKLEVLSDKATSKTDTAYKATVKDLSEKRDVLRAEISKLEADSHGKWKVAKTKMAAAMNSLNEKIQKALKD
jgi:cell division protein FtsB